MRPCNVYVTVVTIIINIIIVQRCLHDAMFSCFDL